MEDRTKRITVSLTEETYEALRLFAFDSRSSLSTAVMVLCEDGLVEREYGKKQSDGFEGKVKR